MQMTESQQRLIDHVVSQAESLEEADSADDIDYLSVEVRADIDGTAREFTLITTTGGPQIEVNVNSGTVEGYWGGDSHTTHFNNEALAADLWELLSVQWESATPQT